MLTTKKHHWWHTHYNLIVLLASILDKTVVKHWTIPCENKLFVTLLIMYVCLYDVYIHVLNVYIDIYWKSFIYNYMHINIYIYIYIHILPHVKQQMNSRAKLSRSWAFRAVTRSWSRSSCSWSFGLQQLQRWTPNDNWSYVTLMWGFPWPWGSPKKAGGFISRAYRKIPSFEMEDDWGYPHDETETSMLPTMWAITTWIIQSMPLWRAALWSLDWFTIIG